MIVVDANISVALLVRLDYSEKSSMLFQGWHTQGIELCAPSIWHAEIVSVLRKMILAGQITAEDAQAALANLVNLPVTVIQPDVEVLQASLEWAKRMGTLAAYDAQYIALADHLGAEFWTADRKLYDNLAANLPWLHWVGET
jgi:predicted nucleic acid-binding protein